MFYDSVIAKGWNLIKGCSASDPTYWKWRGRQRSSLKVRFPKKSGQNVSTKGRTLFFLFYNVSLFWLCRELVQSKVRIRTHLLLSTTSCSGRKVPLWLVFWWRPQRAFNTYSVPIRCLLWALRSKDTTWLGGSLVTDLPVLRTHKCPCLQLSGNSRTERKHIAEHGYWDCPHITFLYLKTAIQKLKLLLLSWQQNCGKSFRWKENQWRLAFWLCLFIKGRNDSPLKERWLGEA